MIPLRTIALHAAARPDAAALICPQSQLSWAGLGQQTLQRIALLLNRYGQELPRQACFLTQNRIDLLPWWAACTTLGIPVAGLDYSLSASALRQLLEQAQADLLIYAREQLPTGVDLPWLLRPGAWAVDLDAPPILSGPYVASESLEAALAQFKLPARPFRSLGFTSGTSSTPKLVVRTASFEARRHSHFIQRYSFNAEDRFLVSMPLYHAAGHGWARLFLAQGACLHLTAVDVPGELAASMRRWEISASVMTPVLLQQLLQQVEALPAERRPDRLRWLLIGGKHCPAPLKLRALTLLGACLHEYYGTTETGVNTWAEPQDIAACPQSVGRALDGSDIAIVDVQGHRLPPLSVGTVAVHSYQNMACYLNQSSRNLNLGGDTYLLTAEQGYLDASGRLFLLNRSDDPQHQVHLYRLEDAIRGLPCISDVAIVCVGGGARQRMDCALQVRNTADDPERLLARVRHLAAREKVSFSRCQVLPSIPYSPSGKVRVTALAALMGP